MSNKAEGFFRQIKDKNVAFMGIGVSHTETIRLFARQGISVTACDKRTAEELGEVSEELSNLGVSLKLGETYCDDLDADIVFRTPGMRYTMPELVAFHKKGGIVTSELEVFFDLCPCPIIGVTGSDGKTTTTTLIAEMLRAQGRRVHLGGNIGRALLPIVMEIDPADIAVVELSSFQLISMRSSPQISVVTNITPNHLDMHADMQEYIDAKKNIFQHQNAFSRTVLGADNETAASFAGEIRGECSMFSLNEPQYSGAWLGGDDTLYLSRRGKVLPVMKRREIRLPGIHNVANYLAAISAIDGLAEPETMRKVAVEFGGVEHRIEFVREHNGVKWYNDSIATSPTRTIAGLRSFEQRLVILAGGYDKKIPFDPLAPELVEHVRLLILSGPTAKKIETAVLNCPAYSPGNPEIVHAESLEQAVELAHRMTVPGDIVSLSPACASFDAYPNFEARGRHFKELVSQL